MGNCRKISIRENFSGASNDDLRTPQSTLSYEIRIPFKDPPTMIKCLDFRAFLPHLSINQYSHLITTIAHVHFPGETLHNRLVSFFRGPIQICPKHDPPLYQPHRSMSLTITLDTIKSLREHSRITWRYKPQLPF